MTIFFFYGNAFFDLIASSNKDFNFLNRYHIGISYALYIFGGMSKIKMKLTFLTLTLFRFYFVCS